MLVDTQIIARLDEMFDLQKSENVKKDDLIAQVNPNSIDLTIAKHYKRPNAVKNPVVYGFSGADERKLYDFAYWKDCTADDGYIVLKPNDIILGATREYVMMPDDMSGQLFTKSTMGRMFINHMMAGVVDAGFRGVLTLELRNEGVHTIRIPVGAPVVQMICYDLARKPEKPYWFVTRRSRYMGAQNVETAKWKER